MEEFLISPVPTMREIPTTLRGRASRAYGDAQRRLLSAYDRRDGVAFDHALAWSIGFWHIMLAREPQGPLRPSSPLILTPDATTNSLNALFCDGTKRALESSRNLGMSTIL